MDRSESIVKRRSFGLRTVARSAAALLVAGGVLSGCIIVGDHDQTDNYDDTWEDKNPPPAIPDPMLVVIDTDQTMEAVPGDGVGIFVEYSSGGDWLLWTTCDTNTSGLPCAFDVFAAVDTSSKLESFEAIDTEGHDVVEVLDSGEAHLHADTASDIDGMHLVTTPGAILRVEVALDGVSSQQFVYWVGKGVLHTGAPTNPVDFQPSVP